ncbi:MAG: flagellar basal body L-ring protein FlgH [Armatimonadota bacterium]
MLKHFSLTSAVLILAAACALGDSLWTSSGGTLFSDARARTVGDLVTVRIVEGASSTQKASTDFSKDMKHSNEAGLGPLLKNIPEIAFKSGQSGKAAGETKISTNLVAVVTAVVTKVRDNGNLEIEAQREVVTNSEKQQITLSAVVRPQDIAADNSVASTSLAEVQIKYSGKGAIGDRQKEGIISKLLRWLF